MPLKAPPKYQIPFKVPLKGIPTSSLGTYFVPERTKEESAAAPSSTWKPSSLLPPPKPTSKGSANPESAREQIEEVCESAESAYKEASPTVFAVWGDKGTSAKAGTQLQRLSSFARAA